MGVLSHIITFGAGIYLGTYFSKPNNGPLIKINTTGVTLGTTDVVKITPERVDLYGSFKIHRGQKND
jgi:hypothetical protein